MSDPTPTFIIKADILYNVSHNATYYEEPVLTVVGAGGRFSLVLTSPYFRVSPHSWEVIYDVPPYETLTGRIVQKVRGFRPVWEIEALAIGFRYLVELSKRITQMTTRVNPDLTPIFKGYFQPPGDPSRPTVEVTIDLGNTWGIDYFADKYRGYKTKIRLIGQEIYTSPVLPVSIPTDRIVNVDFAMGVAGLEFEALEESELI